MAAKKRATKAPGAMTPQEFLKIREELGLTQVELGRLLGVTSLAVSFYERGHRAISPTISLLLRRIRDAGG